MSKVAAIRRALAKGLVSTSRAGRNAARETAINVGTGAAAAGVTYGARKAQGDTDEEAGNRAAGAFGIGVAGRALTREISGTSRLAAKRLAAKGDAKRAAKFANERYGQYDRARVAAKKRTNNAAPVSAVKDRWDRTVGIAKKSRQRAEAVAAERKRNPYAWDGMKDSEVEAWLVSRGKLD